MDVSQSKIKTWRNCRKAYFYKYEMKLTKKFKPQPLLRGTIIHEFLEAHYKGKNPWVAFKKQMEEHGKTIRLNPEEYGNLEKDLRVMLKGYLNHYKQEDLKPYQVEYEFRTKLTPGIYLTGKIDLIARAQKLNWLGEHKCHNIIPSNGMVPYSNMQSSLYIWAYEQEGDKKLDGVMWNYLLGKPPTSPKLLKSGEMSKRSSSNTTWPIYKKALLKHDLDPEDYQDVKESLQGNENNFYQRKFVAINRPTILNVLEDTKTTAKEISKLGGIDQTRNLGRHCDFCEFKNLCQAQLKGLDDNYIIKSDFTTRSKKK